MFQKSVQNFCQQSRHDGYQESWQKSATSPLNYLFLFRNFITFARECAQLRHVFSQVIFLLNGEGYTTSENIVGALAYEFDNFQIHLTQECESLRFWQIAEAAQYFRLIFLNRTPGVDAASFR